MKDIKMIADNGCFGVAGCAGSGLVALLSPTAHYGAAETATSRPPQVRQAHLRSEYVSYRRHRLHFIVSIAPNRPGNPAALRKPLIGRSLKTGLAFLREDLNAGHLLGIIWIRRAMPCGMKGRNAG